MYYSSREVFSTSVYWVQLVFAFIVNWGVNFGFEWATLTNYGQKSMQPIKFWTKNSVNASVLSDVIISTMIIAFLHVTLATWGIKDEVRKKFNLYPIHKSVLLAPEWRYYWPVRVQGVIRRGAAFAVFFLIVIGVPYMIILAIALKWDDVAIEGKTYCVIKASYCGFLTLIMFPGMFFSAISSDKFEVEEYAYLLDPHGGRALDTVAEVAQDSNSAKHHDLAVSMDASTSGPVDEIQPPASVEKSPEVV